MAGEEARRERAAPIPGHAALTGAFIASGPARPHETLIPPFTWRRPRRRCPDDAAPPAASKSRDLHAPLAVSKPCDLHAPLAVSKSRDLHAPLAVSKSRDLHAPPRCPSPASRTH